MISTNAISKINWTTSLLNASQTTLGYLREIPNQVSITTLAVHYNLDLLGGDNNNQTVPTSGATILTDGSSSGGSLYAEGNDSSQSETARTPAFWGPAPDQGTTSIRSLILPPTGCLVSEQQFRYLPWDNPGSVLSLETTLLAWKVISSGLLPALALTGVVVNVLNAAVFARLGLRERINFLLFCVALADLLVVVYNTLVALELFASVLAGRFQMFGEVVTFVTNHNLSWFYSFFYVSAFLTTLVAVDRCLCITRPFAAKRLLKTTYTAVLVACVTAILVGCHYVVADKYRIYCLYYPALGVAMKNYYPSPFYEAHTQLVDVLNGVVYGVTLPAFFVLTTAAATTVTAVRLRSAATFRKDQGGQDKKEVAVTKMLIAVSCLFIACTIPNVLFRLIPLFLPDYSLGGRNQNMLTLFVAVVHLTSVLNCSLNFFFYLRMGSRFRSALCRLCCSLSGSLYLKGGSSSFQAGGSAGAAP